ncbi:MAG TPA: hypothetical protein VNC50_04990, partial [Planctomycetia bacterium]|nr:hypothetical protein [Planctomycetia bacterium]
TVVYFNDIEYGLNVSSFEKHGAIDRYGCDQGGLQAPIYDLLRLINEGTPSGGFGAPRAVEG